MLAPGDTLAGYRIEGVLGQGGMGVVYRATQLSLARPIALKLVASHLSEDPIFRERLDREGNIQATLEHPNIVTIYDKDDSDEGLFIAMQLIDGPNLKELLLTGSLAPSRSLQLLRQVAEAVDAAHDANLVHRDIKPQNILVGPRDHAYLADFGLTKPPGRRGLTGTGQMLGSLDYISPEQIRGEEAEPRSDIYSFGAVLYECLTGIVPYPKETEGAILWAHMTDPQPSVSAANPQLPVAVDEPVRRALAKAPEDRPARAVEIIEAVERAAKGRLPDTTPRLVIAAPRAAETTAEAVPSAPRSETPVTGTIIDRRPAAPPAPGPPAPAASRSAWRILVPVSVAIVVALTVAGFATGTTASGSDAARTVVHTADISASLPPGWQRTQAPASKYGMTFARPLFATDRAGGGVATLTAGWVKSASESLLPSAAAAYALTVDVQHPKTASVAGGAAYAYVGRDRNLIAFFVPTTQGVLSVVCENPIQGPGSLNGCESISSTIRLLKAMPLRLGPNPSYALDVQQALRAAAGARVRQLQAMRAAKRPNLQASAARQIAAAYAHAAAKLAHAAGSDPRLVAANTTLVAALRRVAGAYMSLAGAAAADNAGRYDSDTVTTTRAERALASSFRGLRSLGYRVAGS